MQSAKINHRCALQNSQFSEDCEYAQNITLAGEGGAHLTSDDLYADERSQVETEDHRIDLQYDFEDISLPPMGLALPSSGFHVAGKEHSNSQMEVDISRSMLTDEKVSPAKVAIDDGTSSAQMGSEVVTDDEGTQGTFCTL
jgi:hypothetical protein